VTAVVAHRTSSYPPKWSKPTPISIAPGGGAAEPHRHRDCTT
jgi:hypothetical protein